MKLQLRCVKSGNLVFIGVLTLVLASASVGWAAQIVVTTLADSGPGSLRAAITSANNDGVPTTITFDPVVFPSPPVAPGVILLSTVLPTLTGAGDIIDGTGSGVVLDGSPLPQDCTISANCVGLRVRVSNVTIRGLTIQNFPFDAIRVEPAPPAITTVTGVLIDGNALAENGRRGIRITGGPGPQLTVSATVTNNTITGSEETGIIVLGNIDATGDQAGNTVGVLIDGNTVMSTKKAPPNFGGGGIVIHSGVGTGNGNQITATVSNNTVMNNADDGIVASGCGDLFRASGMKNAVDVTIINNTVKDNAKSGIVVSASEPGSTCALNTMRFQISGNTVSGNTTNINVTGGPGTGHDVQGVISDNPAIKNSPDGDGIVVAGGSGTGNMVHDITILGNVVSNNFARGILISGGNNSANAVLDRIDIVSNSVSKNGDQGILVSGGTNSQSATISDVLIDSNSSTGNGSRGIQATRGSTLSSLPPVITLAGITNNATSTNALDGILISFNVLGLGSTPVSGNQADRNGTNGISVNSIGYVLSNNTASRNAAAGITAVGNTDGGGNTATRNASCNTPGCF